MDIIIFAILGGMIAGVVGFVFGYRYALEDSKDGVLGNGNTVNSNLLLTYALAPVLASISLDIDLQPFFDALNDYLPIFISVFAVIGGLVAAMGFARYIVNAFISAFNGGRI